MFSCSGSDIYNTVRRAHGILIMLNHYKTVSQVS